MRKTNEKKYSKKKELEQEQVNNEEDEDKVDYNGMEVVVDRVEHGLIGTLRITDKINWPLFKNNDMVHIRATTRPFIKDIILYKSHDEYFLRRIIKIKEDTAYVAGDNEKSYHIVHREDIVGKVIGRERNNKFLSFGLNPKNKMYTFKKVKLAPFRLGNRVTNYEEDVNNQALEIAQQKLLEQQTILQQQKTQANVFVDADLSSFLDPDELVKELRAGTLNQANIDNEEEEYEEYEEVEEYIDDENLQDDTSSLEKNAENSDENEE